MGGSACLALSSSLPHVPTYGTGLQPLGRREAGVSREPLPCQATWIVLWKCSSLFSVMSCSVGHCLEKTHLAKSPYPFSFPLPSKFYLTFVLVILCSFSWLCICLDGRKLLVCVKPGSVLPPLCLVQGPLHQESSYPVYLYTALHISDTICNSKCSTHKPTGKRIPHTINLLPSFAHKVGSCGFASVLGKDHTDLKL